jgi:hypothetical protein
MRTIPDQLKSRNLVPFKRRQGKYNIPGMTTENQGSMDRVDTDLSPEEQSYVRHYLGYADALIRSAEENDSPKAKEVSSPESALSTGERMEQQPPAEKSGAGPMNDSSAAKKDPAVRAA